MWSSGACSAKLMKVMYGNPARDGTRSPQRTTTRPLPYALYSVTPGPTLDSLRTHSVLTPHSLRTHSALTPYSLRTHFVLTPYPKAIGWSATQCKDAGMTAGNALEATFDVRSCLDAGWTLAELVAAGFDVRALREAGASVKELLAAGATIPQMKTAGA